MASADDSGRGYQDSEADSEGGVGEAPTSEEQTTGDWEDGDDVMAPSEEPPYLEEPGQGTGLRANGQPSDGDVRSEQDKWRRWAWAALVVLVIGVAWALALSTILLNRSGDNTAELIALFEKSQEQRKAAVNQTSQNQDARRAALHATQAESQALARRRGPLSRVRPRATPQPAEPWRKRLSQAPAPTRRTRRRRSPRSRPEEGTARRPPQAT